MMVSISRFSLLFVLMMGVLVVFVVAQNEMFSANIEVSNIVNDHWTSDSTGFIYQDVSAGLSTWFRLDIDSQQITAFDDYPINPPLSDMERQELEIGEAVRVSPDGQLLLYVTEGAALTDNTEGEHRQFFYTLANRTTQQHTATAIRAPDAIGFGTQIDIVWGEDSDQLAIGTLAEAGTRRVDYIAIKDTEALENMVRHSFEQTIDGSSIYTVDPLFNHLFDVEDDDQFVLLSAQKDDPDLDAYAEQTAFILWNPITPSQSRVLEIKAIEAGLAVAAFASQSHDELYIWQFDGFGELSGQLYRFNIESDQLYELTSLNTVYKPNFSPDGQWFSYYTEDELIFLSLEVFGQGKG